MIRDRNYFKTTWDKNYKLTKSDYDDLFDSFYSVSDDHLAVQLKTINGESVSGIGNISTSAVPYSLPTASVSALGGIKIGSSLSIDGNGVVNIQSNLINLTSASNDVLLTPGQTAFIDYVSGTTIPLHVQMQYGCYEIDILGEQGALNNDWTVWFQINGADQSSSAFYNWGTYEGAGGGQQIIGASFNPAIIVSTSTVYNANVRIQYSLNNIQAYSESVLRTSSTALQSQHRKCISQTNLTWTSMGNIVFPFPQTGKIIIRRIV